MEGITENPYPIANPIVRANVDQCLDAAFEEGSDVEICREYTIQCGAETHGDFHTAARKVAAQRWVDTNCLADIGAVEETSDFSVNKISKGRRKVPILCVTYFVIG